MTSALNRISIDPNVCFGKPCIKGARIWLSLVLDFLAEGQSTADIIKVYPQLTPADVNACLTYGVRI